MGPFAWACVYANGLNAFIAGLSCTIFNEKLIWTHHNRMFDSIKHFFNGLGRANQADAQEPEIDVKLAAAAILVHAVNVDGFIEEAEKAKLADVLKRQFDLSDKETKRLIDDARERDNEAVDLYGFTSVLNRQLDDDGRREIVAMLWEIVFADGVVHEFEDNLVWRVSDLLGVSTRTRMNLKRAVGPET